MKNISCLICGILALSLTSCTSNGSQPTELSLRYSGNTVPAGLVGDWSLDSASGNPKRLMITASGNDCLMCNELTATGANGWLQASGITWFDTGSCDACGSFTFYPLSGSISQQNATQKRAATKEELNSFHQQYNYTTVNGVIKISSDESDLYREKPITKLTE